MGATDMKTGHQVKSKDRVRDFGEVFTKPETVRDMLDLLPPDVFMPEKTFLEPCCGEGVFLLEILRRKFAKCRCRKDYTAAISSVYGMDIQADNVEICIRNIIALCEEQFRITNKERAIINDHIMQADALKVMKMMAERSEP